MTLLAALLVPLVVCQEAGRPFPAWTPGTLDIHQISTGRGNAALVVFPDAKTLLIDAGAVPDRDGLEVGPRRPDASLTPAEWITRYIRRFSPRPALDYALITHYHDDHMGALAGVAGAIPVATLIDRGLDPPPPPYPIVQRYLEFRRNFSGRTEVLRPGASSQIKADGVEVRNVAANGFVWTGEGDRAASPFPAGWRTLAASQQPGENDFSLALVIRYGRFRYYTGGDLAGVPLDDLPVWRELETPVARAIGQVDVAVLNHHGWLDSTNAFFLQTLRPRVAVIPAWHATHPDHSVLRRLRSPSWKPAPPDLYITALLDAPRAIFRYLGESFKSTAGHIVIRVQPAGGYRVVILDDSSESWMVKQVSGPY